MKLRNVQWISTFLMVLAFAGSPAAAVQVQDIAHLKGSESNKIIGMGLVVGLSGTGDGGKPRASGFILFYRYRKIWSAPKFTRRNRKKLSLLVASSSRSRARDIGP